LSAGQQFFPVQSPAVRLASAGTTFIEGANPTFRSNLQNSQRGVSQQEQNQQFFQDVNRDFSQAGGFQQRQSRFQPRFRDQFQNNNALQVINEQERFNFQNQPSRDNAFFIQQQRDIEFAAQQNRNNAFKSQSSRNNAFQSQSNVAFQNERQNRNNFAFQQPRPQFNAGSDFNFDESSVSGVFEPLNLPSGASALLGGISSSFSCADRPYGYYADPDNFCRVFHICNPALFSDGAVQTYQYSFFCGEGSIFDQAKLTCAAEFEATPCGDAPNFYFRNEVFGRDVEA